MTLEGGGSSSNLQTVDIPYTKNQKQSSPLLTFLRIGSFRKALERSRGKCVFTNEILEQSMYTYSENFNIEPRELNLDYLETFVYQTNMEKIPKSTVLLRGFLVSHSVHLEKGNVVVVEKLLLHSLTTFRTSYF